MIPLVAGMTGVVLAFVLSIGRDAVKDRRERHQREALVRRLLAHHAAMLLEDCEVFLSIAPRCFGLPDAEIALRFRDATTREHGHRDQIGAHIGDLSDELIDLLRDLDAATADAATAVQILQRRATEAFQPRMPGTIQLAGVPLSEEIEHAGNAYLALRDAALAVLRRLESERAELPPRARLSLSTRETPLQLPPPSSRVEGE